MDEDIYIIEVKEPEDAPPILTMDEFLGRVVKVYPDLADRSFAELVEEVAGRTNSLDLYSKCIEEGENLLEFLHKLVNRLPNGDSTN